MSAHVKDSGTWKEAVSIHAKDSGTWKSAVQGYVKDSGTWKLFFDSAASGGALSADVSPGFYFAGDLPVNYTFTVGFDAIVSGGTSPYTYVWTITGSAGATISGAANQQSVTVQLSNSSTPATVAATLTCVVTDDAGASVTVNVSISVGFGNEIE